MNSPGADTGSNRSVGFLAWLEVNKRRLAIGAGVIASQAANSYIAGQKFGFQEAGKETDALAISPYVTMNLSPDGKPSAAEVAGWKVEQVLDYLETNALPDSVRWIKDNKAVADKHGLKVIVYEGGR